MVKGNQDKAVLVQENEESEIMNPKSHQEEHERHNRVKHGKQRLDKRSAQGVSGLPKKSGQGGKFTWGSPVDPESPDDVVVALDEKDPNYVDEEEVVKQNAQPVPEVSPSEKGRTKE